MKALQLVVMLLLVGYVGVVSVNGGELLDSNYIKETYATFKAWSFPCAMTFDDQSNLYVTIPNEDKIMKVDNQGNVSAFCTGMNLPIDILSSTSSSFPYPLYVVDDVQILGMSLDGSSSKLTDINYPYDGPYSLAQSTGGAYGDFLYFGTASYDRIGRIDASGNVSTFSSWPGQTNGGGPFGMEFDPTGLFGGSLYVAAYFTNNSQKSGVFTIDAQGNATRSSCSLLNAKEVEFDHVGTMFDHDLFVYGANSWDGPSSIWRVKPDGTTTEFYTNATPGMVFGADGSLYVSEIDYTADIATISRIVPVPEPLTLSLLALGGLALRRR